MERVHHLSKLPGFGFLSCARRRFTIPCLAFLGLTYPPKVLAILSPVVIAEIFLPIRAEQTNILISTVKRPFIEKDIFLGWLTCRNSEIRFNVLEFFIRLAEPYKVIFNLFVSMIILMSVQCSTKRIIEFRTTNTR